jgi:diazepam-binding inhibitor (GABA receptor modulator, acyl-CoA-binding protein)
MVLKNVFNEAAERVKQLADASNDDQLELYSYFKQANVGDCNTSKHGHPMTQPLHS